MRIIGLAVFILIISYIIKTDLLDGTISLAAFSQVESECVNKTNMKSSLFKQWKVILCYRFLVYIHQKYGLAFLNG